MQSSRWLPDSRKIAGARLAWSGLPLALSLLLLSSCGTMPPPEPTRPLGSRVELAAGEVWLLQTPPTPGGQPQRQRLITGAMLPDQATLEVSPGGRCLIRLGSGTSVFMRGGSQVELQGDAFSLRQGEVWADVPEDDRELGRFTAGGITVTASGAGFDLLHRDGRVQVYVARGLAVVASPGGRTEVESGEQARVEGNAAPQVSPVAFWDDWTGGMADRRLDVGQGGRGAGRIYGIDPTAPGTPPQELQILSQQVGVRIEEGLAYTTVQQSFFNPSSTPLEGWYWFTVPLGASVGRFAVEVDGRLIEGEMVERQQAAAAYAEAIRKAFDPALLEWVDGRTFRARIHPIPPAGSRQVTLSYMELLPLTGSTYRYVYPMGGAGETRIQEFALTVDLGPQARELEIATLQEARLDSTGRFVSMRRSGFLPQSDFLLELRRRQPADPLQVRRFATGGQEADYVMLRFSPDVDWKQVERVQGDVVVVLDTSAGGEDADRQVRTEAVEAILRALSSGDRFAVMTADLIPRVVYPTTGLAEATEANIAQAVERLAEVSSAGATDLGEMFHVALERIHEAEQPAVVYVGDGLATVGELTSAALAERLRRSLADSRARLFTLSVGAEANHGLLERLARVGGGQALRVEGAEQTVQEALRLVGLIKTPTITDLVVQAGAGLDQLFSTVTGKVSEGEEVILLARTHHDLPGTIVITGRLGAQPFRKEYQPTVEAGGRYAYIQALWARQYLTQLMGEGLEQNRGSVIHLGLNYSLMTPLTSFLVLDSEQAYQQQGIPRRPRPQWGLFQEPCDDAVRTAARSGLIAVGLLGCGMEGGREAPGAVATSTEQVRTQDYSEAAKVSAPSPADEAAAPTMSARRAPAEMSRSMGPPPAPPSAAPALPAGAAGSASGRTRMSPARSMPSKPMDDHRAEAEPDVLATLGGAVREKRGAMDRNGEETPTSKTLAQILAEAKPADGDRPRFKTTVCSDASRRSLAQRRILWQSRLLRTAGTEQAVRVFLEAGQRCELPRWQDVWVLLDLLEQRVKNAEDVRQLLTAFLRQPRLQAYLRKRILRRTLDPETTLGLFFPTAANWAAVDQGLAATADPKVRLETVRKILEGQPDDPLARSRWVVALLDVGRQDDARAEAERLRREGQAGPQILQLLCDLEAEAGHVDEARRICSELVEFNAEDPALRQLLGDLFLRHRWHDAAYREYKTLVELRQEEPTAMLRLALAAAGAGRVDEALRLARKVSGDDDVAGPSDPRRAARYHTAVQLANLLLQARQKQDQEQQGGLVRSLKRSQVFHSPGSLLLLTWEDLASPLGLELLRGKEQLPVADRLLAPETGLVAFDLGRQPLDGVTRTIRLQGAPVRRSVAFAMFTVSWDGREFQVKKQTGELKPYATEVTLEP